MESEPRISVIMSVYNSALFLREAVDSILNQTYKDFEFLIVDDKSTDESLAILESYKDERIVIICNNQNIGLTKNLNKLIKFSKGEFIARMDADDISLPNRFDKQIEFLEKHPEVVLCGTQIQQFGFRTEKSNNALSYFEIKQELLLKNCIAHSTVIWRNNQFKKFDLYYDENFKSAQDYELWTRVSYRFQIQNLEETLLLYRVHNEQISTQNSEKQNENAFIIKISQLKRLGIELTNKDINALQCIFSTGFQRNLNSDILIDVDSIFYRIFLKNKSIKYFDDKFIINLWEDRLFGSSQYTYDLQKWKIRKNTIFYREFKMTKTLMFKYFLKCLINKKNNLV